MQSSNTPDKLVLPFAASGAKNTIPAASQIGITAGKASLTDGFPPLTRTPLSAGGVPPSGLDMNGILYEMSAIIRWVNAGGGYPYDGTFATDTNVGGYPKGARIMRSDGTGYWFNTAENNVTDPESAGAAAAGWVPDFTTGVAAVTMTSANVTLTPAQYGKPTIVITGTLTSNLNLIFPNITGLWSIVNSTTGDFAITAKTAIDVGIKLTRFDFVNSDGNSLNSISNEFSKAAGSYLIGHLNTGAGATPTTVGQKLQELPSSTDFLTLQESFDNKFANITPNFHDISNAVKIPSLSAFDGVKSGIAFTGTSATVKHAIRKTTNATTPITNFQTSITTNVDCLAYIDPDWIDGAAYPQKVTLENMSFEGAAASPNDKGIYIEQGGGFTFKNLDFANITHAIWCKEAWLMTLERVHAQGKFVWVGGTSVTFADCWTGSGSSSTGGYDFASLSYSTMNSCASDGATDTAYKFVNSKLTLNSCGCENANTSDIDRGTAIAFNGGCDIVLNDFNVVPQTGQIKPIFSAGQSNNITFQNGSSYFGTVNTCPDLLVWFDNSTIVFNDYVFANGTKNAPNIKFATGVTTSIVIVNYGTNQKIFKSDGTGATLVESTYDKGAFTPALSFNYGTVGITYSSVSGHWQKNGNVITVSGRISLSNKGSSSGTAILTGWPTFNQQNDAQLSLILQTGIVNGPLVGVIDRTGPAQCAFNVRSATGDSVATEANFTNTTVVWFSFTYQLE